MGWSACSYDGFGVHTIHTIGINPGTEVAVGFNEFPEATILTALQPGE
jgi:hypothetical protein